jgi:ornithine decarboxylase
MKLLTHLDRLLAAWWRVFGWAEICGTVTAFAGFAAVAFSGGPLVAAAELASWTELVGFYGFIGGRAVHRANAANRHHRAGWKRCWHIAKYGVREDHIGSCLAAEGIDLFLLRPLLILAGSSLFQQQHLVWLGFFVGKLVADVCYYLLEWRARRLMQWRGRNKRRTPFLLLSVPQAVKKYRELAGALPGVVVLHFAMKCNPDPRLLAALFWADCRFEAASWAELQILIGIGVDPADVLFSNPVKSRDDIKRAWKAGVWRFAVDSVDELKKLAQLAEGASVYAVIGADHGGEVGSNGKFGITWQKAAELLVEARRLGLNPYGLSFHVGSQQLDPQAWYQPILDCGDAMRRLSPYGIKITMLDLGGGFPARYDVEPPPLSDYGTIIQKAMTELPYQPEYLAAEPGRCIAARAGIIVATVIGVAYHDGKCRVSVDAGAFHGLMEALESGQKLGFPITPLVYHGHPVIECIITGPSCDTQDGIRRIWMSPPEEGDLVVIEATGAYTNAYVGAFNGMRPITVQHA